MVALNGRCAHRVDVILRFFGALDARRAYQQVLLQGREFRLVRHHAEIVSSRSSSEMCCQAI